MKKTFITLFIALAAVTAIAASNGMKDDKYNEVKALVDEYDGKPGFEVQSLNSVGLDLMINVARAEADDAEDRRELRALKGLIALIVVDYEETFPADRMEFIGKLGMILQKYDKIMEIREDGDKVDIYGIISPNGKAVKDFILHVPGEQTLICALGTVDLRDIGALTDVED